MILFIISNINMYTALGNILSAIKQYRIPPIPPALSAASGLERSGNLSSFFSFFVRFFLICFTIFLPSIGGVILSSFLIGIMREAAGATEREWEGRISLEKDHWRVRWERLERIGEPKSSDPMGHVPVFDLNSI